MFTMYKGSFLLLTVLVTLGCASPTSRHVVHEKRDVLPSGWTIKERLNQDTRLPLRIGLKQRNLHLGPEFLLEVSSPSSPQYGQHWSPEQVVDMFSPRYAIGFEKKAPW